VGEVINLILRAALFTAAQGNNGIELQAIPSLILGTDYGHLWLVRVALIAIALASLNWATRRHRTGTRTSSPAPTRSPGTSYRQLRLQFPPEGGASGVSVSGSKERSTDTLRKPISTRPTTLPAYSYIVAWLVIAALILLTLALSGDAAQLAQPHITAIVLDWLYLAAQCIWFGGIAYLGYVLLPLLPSIEPDHHGEKLAILLRRYTPLTIGALSVLLVNLLFLSESSLSSAQQLVSDPYGRALLVKILLIVSMLIFSGYALFFLRPKLARQAALLPVVDTELPIKRARQTALLHTERSLKQTMRLSSWLAAGVLLCAALMAFFAPPIEFPAVNYTSSSGSTTAPASGQNLQTKQIGDLSVSLVVLPGRVDYANSVILTLNDSNGNPVTNAQVQISINMELMNMGDFHKTVSEGNPTYVATFAPDTAFSMSGLWDVGVMIVRPNAAPVQGTFQVMLS
jgi:putative copper export protein